MMLCISLVKSVRKEGRKDGKNNKIALLWLRAVHPLLALWKVSEFFSCMQLEYCLREPLSEFEGVLSTAT